MKNKLVYACIIMSVAVASCSNNNKAANTTTNADTAVLVNDQANNLNASPVNDTTVKDTVHNQQ